MKKQLLIILLIFFIIICIIVSQILRKVAANNELKNYNAEYEKYLQKDITTGAELISLINQVVDLNERNNIKKDKNGRYINDNESSIKIDIEMIAEKVENTEEIQYTLYPMESFAGSPEFVQYFSLIDFKCIKIEHHEQTGKVSRILFRQMEE